MKKLVSLLGTTIARGALFLTPFAVLLIVIAKLYSLAEKLLVPMAERLHIPSLVGFKAPWVLAALIVLAVCFAAGLLARTSAAHRLVVWLETTLLSNLPGYSLMKTVGEEAAGIEPSDRYQSVLIRLDDCHLLGFLVEQLFGRHAVVFIPGAPKPWEGDVIIVEQSRVTLLTSSSGAAVTCLRKLGDGVGSLVDGKLPNVQLQK